MSIHLVKVLVAEAAHRNPAGDEAQQRLHGHSYKLEVLASGPEDPETGWVVDFAELKQIMQPVYEQLDHGYLNEIPELISDSSLPAVQRWIEQRLSGAPGWLRGVRVSILGDLTYDPIRLPEDAFEGLPERLRFTFEAAQALPHLAEGHPCRKIHGHSYRMEVGTHDLGMLGRRLADLYGILDHRYLNEIPGLEWATCERICRWAWAWLEEQGESPTVVVVQETDSSRCVYSGEG